MDTDNLAVYSLVEQLLGYGRKQFTGKLELHSVKDYKWSIYYCHGRLVWASGGVHNHRRWQRLMGQYKLQIDFNKISFRTADEIRLWDYQVLVILMKRLVLSREQITPIIEGFVQEVLFDIIQCAANEKITYYCDFEDEITPVIALIHAEHAINQAHQKWLTWRKAGIADFSPNLAPWIKRPSQLKEEASELTYKTLITILDGRRSLRELSTWMKKDLLNLVQSLMAYYHRGMVGLVEVQDIESPVASFSLNAARNEQTKLSESSSPQKKLNLMARPLIACVDDSNQVCATIEQIVTGFGFGFLGIRDSINVLPLLVELKPEMIILDLVMPIVGGYELCTQIRRIPEFKDTPILILTSNDTLFDRLRSKFVGATAFISKTAGNEKIGEQIQRYLLPFDNEPEEISSIDSSDTSQ
ncbi:MULTISPECIES: response regulator [Pseudanabaena]|uniref:response regulator n=1 Tax=Pseudanabaena TaxID=1152 RepID=UPI00247B2A29|nr:MULTISPECIES: response regulator [Pseudanabaena]MEA5489882.1 response regulator [Pseudanabaena sp. CCNP1317]WGS74483.1 response regulator [Pseudanabaena galeata CCNP1313]